MIILKKNSHACDCSFLFVDRSIGQLFLQNSRNKSMLAGFYRYHFVIFMSQNFFKSP